MKANSKLVPSLFDDKDIMIPEFWQNIFDNYHTFVPHCEGKADMESLFFVNVPSCGGDRAFKAQITATMGNKIEVTSIHDGGTIWYDEVEPIKDLFMQCNEWDDANQRLYAICQPIKEHDGRYVAIEFLYYKEEDEKDE